MSTDLVLGGMVVDGGGGVPVTSVWMRREKLVFPRGTASCLNVYLISVTQRGWSTMLLLDYVLPRYVEEQKMTSREMVDRKRD